MSYVHTATVVFPAAAAPVAWTDLNISAVTGGRVVWAILKFECTAGADPRIAVRPDADADEYYGTATGPHGSTRTFIALNESGLLAVKTDANGIIEWRASAASTMVVTVVGYCHITEDATNIIPDSTIPTAWTEANTAAIVGNRRSLVVGKWHRTGGTANSMALRPGDDADDYLVTSPELSGANQDGAGALNIYSNILTLTDDAGNFDYIAESVAPAGKLDMACYMPMTVPTTGEEQVYAAAAPPVAWQILDLTVSTGTTGLTGLPAARCLVLLKFHHENLAGASSVAVRGADDGGEYLTTKAQESKGCACATLEADQTTILMCETDANGAIDWRSNNNGFTYDIELLGWATVSTGPTIDNEQPEGNTVEDDHPIIGATIFDEDGIDTSTIGLTATDARGRVTTIISAGVVQSGWSGTIVTTRAGDREITVTVESDGTELGNGELWTFGMTATSVSGGSL
jgi:hypothetical protein